MTYAAIAPHEFPSFGRSDPRLIVVRGAILCGGLFASVAIAHWASFARPPALSTIDTTPTLVQTSVVELPGDTARRSPVAPGAMQALALRVATRALSSGVALVFDWAFAWEWTPVVSIRGTAPASASPARRAVQAVAAAVGAARGIAAADGSKDRAAQALAPRVVPPLPKASALLENVPVPVPRPSFDPPPLEDSASPSRDERVAAPREESVAPPREPAPVPSRRRLARQTAAAAPAPAQEDNRNFLEKLLGIPQRSSGGLAGYDGQTAVYDIAAHTVYLPDGTRLEAHSGLGSRLDDPGSVNHRNRGATPPSVYALDLREKPFHGVRALRLTPIGNANTYGRDGLLAHSYMLGPRGDSNGCVVFRDYDAFLRAYEGGTIRRLAVVASLR